MEIIRNKVSLEQKWRDFFNVLFDPWVIILLFLLLVLLINFSSIKDSTITIVITTLISIVSGLLGGIISYKWSQITETKVIIARGKTAIRGLKLILLNISNIGRRTKNYILNIDTSNIEYKLIKNNFEEVLEKCNILEEEIISSIENWTDIIPEVQNLKTQIGYLSDMKIQETKLEMEIKKLNYDLQSIKKEDTALINQLRTELNLKEKDLLATKEKLASKEEEMNNSILSGLTGTNYGQPIGAELISNDVSLIVCPFCKTLNLKSVDDPNKICDLCNKSLIN